MGLEARSLSPDLGAARAVRVILETITLENPDRDGLLDTPERVTRFIREATAGYRQDPEDVLTTFENATYTGMVTVGPIPFYSLCEHHLVPFFGDAWIAYVPSPHDQRVVGLSKLARLLDVYAHRLQVQERITDQVADALWTHLEPAGVGVMIVARHLCMEMRGVKKAGARTRTTALRGLFKDDPAARAEWLRGCE